MKKFFVGFFKFLGIGIFVAVSVLCGVLIGNTVIDSFFTTNNYALYDPQELKENEAQIIADYTSGKIIYNTLTENDAAAALIISIYTLNQKQNYSVSSEGTVTNPLTNQSLYNSFEKQGNTTTSIQLSGGIFKIANKVVTNLTTGDVEVYLGTLNADGKSATFTSPANTYTKEEYYNIYGVEADEFMGRIVSSKTILSSKIEKGNTTTFTLSLDPVKSVVGYAKQVSVNTGMDMPNFSSVNLTFEIDSSFNLLRFTITEAYTVKYGITVNCNSTVNSTISF